MSTLISKLLNPGSRSQELRLIARNLLQLYKENRKNPSKHVVIFLLSLFSSTTVAVIYTLNKVISDIRDKRDSRPLYKRSSSTILKNGARELFIPYKNRQKRVIIQPTEPELYEKDKFKYKNFAKNIKTEEDHDKIFSSKFLNQLIIIWQILIPKVNDKNSIFLITQFFFLILRTWLSLLIAKLDGQIVKDIIGGKFRKFLRDLAYWFLMAVPASYTNSAIKYLVKKLSVNFRTNLTRYVHDMYLDPRMVYYKVMFNDQSIKDIDNFITTDINRFCNSICSLFSNIGKPMIDLVFFAVYLRDNLGTAGITGIFVNYFISAYILKRNTPPFGKLTKEKSALEGEYYNDHLNLITNSEEIAFYNGTNLEKIKINEIYDKMMNHVFKVNRIKVAYNVLEDYILKYTWSALGYLYASIPIFIISVKDDVKKSTEDRNMRQFIVNKRLMLNMADAGSRLMYSIKDISKLTGYTDRVFTLLTVLHQVHDGDFQFGSEDWNENIKGAIQYHYNGLRFEKINVIIPTINGGEGTKLINELDINLKQHESILILGMNGCGKTSIERILAGLWPLYHGLISKPNDDDIIYLPQKAYFSNGTLRDQLIYPMSHSEMLNEGKTDQDLIRILKEVRLEYLLDRDVGLNYLNSIHDWKDVLSGGEKQRVQFARILFKNPKFVVLDEATNAISSDIEAYLFDLLRKKNFAFITLSHRPLLIKYHDYLLEIHQDGNWSLETLGSDAAIISIEKEIKEIEDKLKDVDSQEDRKIQLENLLDGIQPKKLLSDQIAEID
ncbi:Lipid A export ATP-binding/permease protein msbA [Wickerhamomyces ciferrii]|uniref:Lipid A export ATP-binding/permease protein msbA n=1 Tax=Wickerhamomyces ciferrii (strain ATCC 14091 / BCRC 22168 / CBS 111 / JCM 3599 / NBRC 0793 / NRRL Y-1031 F-60-10) TaxID=1206466 RepID=K0KX67_WICCF|nr:Lipid A export ATP-binding/permease protein msbA [Wickerhamomyces ciferrii]CCH46637.1 Lipid A export ATP-binding/permease protein msbA [Wickerhamomyces ciferrii]